MRYVCLSCGWEKDVSPPDSSSNKKKDEETPHPVDLSPLARRNDENPLVADRFQLLVHGWEVVNAYSELVDPLDQRERLERQSAPQSPGDEEAQDQGKEPAHETSVATVDRGVAGLSRGPRKGYARTR